MSKCAWIGKGEGCNEPATLRSYCECHVWKIYQPGTKLNRRRKDIRVASEVHLWESLFNEAVEELEAEGFDS